MRGSWLCRGGGHQLQIKIVPLKNTLRQDASPGLPANVHLQGKRQPPHNRPPANSPSRAWTRSLLLLLLLLLRAAERRLDHPPSS